MKPKHNPEMVAVIKKSFEGVGTSTMTTSDETFNSTLAASDLTPEVVERVSNHVTTYVASGMEAAGEVVKEAMTKDKKLETVDANVSLGAFGHVDFTVYREKEVTIPATEKGGEPTKRIQHGATKVDVTFVAGKNSGLLGKARAAIKEDFTKQFGGK